MKSFINLTLVLGCFCIISAYAIEKSKTQIVEVNPHPESSKFFASNGNSLIVSGVKVDPKIFGDLNRDLGGGNPDRIKKIPVSYFSDLGLKEGTVVQNINVLNGGKKINYILKKEVNVILFAKSPLAEDERNEPAWSKLNIILSDDPKDHKLLLKNEYNSITGFSYIGEKFKLIEGTEGTIPLKETMEPNPVLKLHFDNFTKKDNVKTASINGHEIFVHIERNEDVSVNSLFIKLTETSYASIQDNNRIVLKNRSSLIVGPWFENAKTLYFGESFSTDQCVSLVIFEKNKVSKIGLPCKDRAE